MSDSKMFYEMIEKKFITWAETAENIRAAFIIGSRAREDHPADEWSDMDIIFFTSEQDFYLSNREWLNHLGNVCTSFVSLTDGGDAECLTLFDGGWQVDFVIHTLDDLKYIAENQIVPDNFHRGVKVLIDKDHLAKNIIPQCNMAPQNDSLSEDKFIESVNMFWFIALYVAKQLLRNELWVAKTRDYNLKQLLLQMIEWHEKTLHGKEYDTWHAGRFLFEWADKETQTRLQETFGHFDRNDSWKALMATITLFKHLAHEVSEKMNFSYPHEPEECIYDWICQKNDRRF